MTKINFIKAMFLTIFLIFLLSIFSHHISYNIGSYTLKVPKENIPNSSPWAWIKLGSYFDRGVDSFIFHFSEEKVASAVDEYTLPYDLESKKVIGAIYLIDENERERLSNPRELADIWYAINGYEDREVTLDKDSGYYFVYEKTGYRGMFYVFSKPPTTALPNRKEEFFIAICSGASLIELKNVSCSRKFLLNPDLMISFSISLENLKAQSEVMLFLENSLSEWIQ